MYRFIIKNIIDRIGALALFLFISPIFLFVWITLRKLNKGSAFFVQARPGKNEAIFNVIKFKTMTDEKDAEGKLLPDEERITKIGHFIRSSSLDEIPQLINIIKGDMSFIGPRPLMPKYLPLYNQEQKKRHNVKPGITGWAQVNGRNNITWKKKFELDIWYVKNLSFFLDFRIILLTIKKVLKKEDVSKEGHATTEAFNGSN